MHFGHEIIKHLLKGLAWLAENFPDDPRLARRLLLIGAFLIAAFFLPDGPPGYEETFLTLRGLSLSSGCVCGLLGAFVFFRRFVWWRQEKAGSGLTTLGLNQPGNNSHRGGVSTVSDEPEVYLSDESFD